MVLMGTIRNKRRHEYLNVYAGDHLPKEDAAFARILVDFRQYVTGLMNSFGNPEHRAKLQHSQLNKAASWIQVS